LAYFNFGFLSESKNKKMTYKIINNGKTAEIKFYGYISSWWNGADDYTRTLAEIEAKGIKDVVIKTHCYGGSVFEGAAIWTANKSSKLNIEFVIEGIAASMMFIVMLSGNKLTISSMGKGMVHAPRDLAGGTSKQLFQSAKLLKSIEKDFINVWMSKTKQTADEASQYMDGTDYWFDAEELVKLGIADGIVTETAFVTEVLGKPDNGTAIEAVFNRYTAMADDNNNFSLNKSTMDKLKLATQLGLTGINANTTDEQFYAAVEAKKSNDLAQEAARVEGEAQNLIEAKEKELGLKFTEEQVKAYKSIATSSGSCDNLKVVLSSLSSAAVPVPITNMLNNQNNAVSGFVAADRASWNWDKWQKEDPAGLEALESTNMAAFKALYEAKFGNKLEARFE
jgi:ATP-dependent Clp protease, protease subunit